MYFANEVGEVAGYGKADGIRISPPEVKLAEQLVSTLFRPFDLKQYRDEYPRAPKGTDRSARERRGDCDHTAAKARAGDRHRVGPEKEPGFHSDFKAERANETRAGQNNGQASPPRAPARCELNLGVAGPKRVPARRIPYRHPPMQVARPN